MIHERRETTPGSNPTDPAKNANNKMWFISGAWTRTCYHLSHLSRPAFDNKRPKVSHSVSITDHHLNSQEG